MGLGVEGLVGISEQPGHHRRFRPGERQAHVPVGGLQVRPDELEDVADTDRVGDLVDDEHRRVLLGRSRQRVEQRVNRGRRIGSRPRRTAQVDGDDADVDAQPTGDPVQRLPKAAGRLGQRPVESDGEIRDRRQAVEVEPDGGCRFHLVE